MRASRQLQEVLGYRCASCGGPWHPASGFIVGSPQEVKICGACFKNDIMPLLKDRMGVKMRVRKAVKGSGKDRFVSFYDNVRQEQE